MPLKFKNKLNVDVNVFFQYKIGQNRRTRRDAVIDRSTGQRKSLVKSDDDEMLDTTGLKEKFKLVIKMDRIPASGNIKGVKVIPGKGLGHSHHIDYHDMDDHFLILIHYHASHEEDHIDPEVDHPEPPAP